TRPIRRPLPMVPPGSMPSAPRASSVPGHGRTTRVMFGLRTATPTMPTYAIRRTGFASPAHPRRRVMDITRIASLSVVALLLLPATAHAQGKAAHKDAYLYFVWPQDGTVIKGAFWARFGLRNMGVTHAGDDFENAGHHHLLIDVNSPLESNEPIPQDKNHLHFGAGQTETRIELPPGKHTLQLVLGDAKHYPFNPPVVSKKITITVK